MFTNSTIANGASITGSIDLGYKRLHSVIIPAAWTSAGISFQVSEDGTTWADLYNEFGEYQLNSSVVGASRCIAVDLALFYGIRYLKIRSGTAAAPIVQSGDRVLTLKTTHGN